MSDRQSNSNKCAGFIEWPVVAAGTSIAFHAVFPPGRIIVNGGVCVAPSTAPEGCWMHFATVFERVRSDFTEMPCLELTLAQATRLWHVGADDCRFVLDALVDEGFLRWTAQHTIVRADHESYINEPDSLLSHIPVRRMHAPYRRA